MLRDTLVWARNCARAAYCDRCLNSVGCTCSSSSSNRQHMLLVQVQACKPCSCVLQCSSAWVRVLLGDGRGELLHDMLYMFCPTDSGSGVYMPT